MKSPVDIDIGKIYDVPCIEVNKRKIPVLLPFHSDGNEHCLKEASDHYHIDFRFFNYKDILGNAIFIGNEHFKPFIHKMKCIRDFVSSLAIIDDSAFFFWERWHRRHSELMIKDGKCPHKGIQLVNKCGTCPAHGLQWNIETGRLADFKLPFYLMLTKNQIIGSNNPYGEIKNNTCEIEINQRFESNGFIIMIDSNRKRYGKMWQRIDAKILNANDKIIFSTDRLCSKE